MFVEKRQRKTSFIAPELQGIASELRNYLPRQCWIVLTYLCDFCVIFWKLELYILIWSLSANTLHNGWWSVAINMLGQLIINIRYLFLLARKSQLLHPQWLSTGSQHQCNLYCRQNVNSVWHNPEMVTLESVNHILRIFNLLARTKTRHHWHSLDWEV